MTLTANLEASFTGPDNFDLSAAIGGLGTLMTDIDLPGLDLHLSVSLDLEGLGTGSITDALGSVTGGLDSIVGALPDLDQLLGPLELAMRVPELLADFDLTELLDGLVAAVAPGGPGLPALVEAATRLGSVPAISSLSGLLSALGLDLNGPGALLGRTANGILSLLELIGGLLAVEAASRSIESRADLAADLLDAERIGGLVARVRASGGVQLASLLTGIDPNDSDLADLVTQPIVSYVGLAAELGDALVRGLAYAEAAVVDADFAALVAALTTASVALSAASPAAARELVASASPLVSQVTALGVPAGGVDVVFGAVAELRTQIEASIDGLAADTLAAFVEPAVAPVLSTVRSVRAVLDEIGAVVGVVFAPIEQALDAVHLEGVATAIETVVTPVADAVEVITDGIAGAQTAIETAVEAVHDALEPVRTGLTNALGTLTGPFTEVHTAITLLDLAQIQQDIHATLDSVTAAIGAAPVQPVFDVATGIIDTAADALGLVPKALLPDDLRHDLEAACAPVESLDLEPARTELHTQLTQIIDSIDASALDAVAAGYRDVTDFITSIDPHPAIAELESQAFAALVSALNALDPTEILAPVLEALDAARSAIAGIDLATVLKPIDDALDEVGDTIDGIDPTTLLAPVTTALDEARGTVRSALHLDDIDALLTAADTAITEAIAKIPLEDVLAEIEGSWSDLVAGLRGTDQPPVGAARGLLAGLLPGVPVEGLPEVVAWIRHERDGSAVVRGRLQRAAATLSSASANIGDLDVRALTAELDANHRALAAALAAYPSDSVLVQRLSALIGSANPAADLGRVVVNVDRVRAAIAEAAGTVGVPTAADRSEVQLSADGLATAFVPLMPVLDKARELAAFIGLDPELLAGPGGVRLAVAALAERLGSDVLLGTIRSISTHLITRLTDLVRDGLITPLRTVLAELTGLLDALSIDTLLADFTALRTRLVALVESLRPSVVLAAPLAAFTGLQTTLATFDPMGPVRTVVDGFRSEITGFVHDLAPSTLLAPVLTVYDDIAAVIGSFDIAGLLEPVLAALRAIGAIIDRGMDEVIDALARLKTACESEGGPIPGLDLSVTASVDVGGLL